MYSVEKVEVYEVRGHKICTKNRVYLEEYLTEVKDIGKIEYLYDKYVVLIGKEGEQFKCKELEHLKFNVLYDTEAIALLIADSFTNELEGVG